MDRKEFLIKACIACLGVSSIPVFLSSCSVTRYSKGSLTKNGLLVNEEDFKMRNGAYQSFIIVRNDALLFPVCLFRFSSSEYSAVWMQCTHQGAELNVSGEYLQCPAHGSEFNSKGLVTGGPADRNLRTFPVTVENGKIFIDMRKI